jgi:MSHA pilin protein MshD
MRIIDPARALRGRGSPDTIGHFSRRGFTLAEGLIASVVLAAAVAGIVGPLGASYQQTALGRQRSVAVSLAEQLLEEIIARPFVDPTDGSLSRGPEPGENGRGNFDNVDDYHGYTDSTATLSAMNGAGLGYSGGQSYTRTVTVQYRSTRSGPEVASGDFALVTVTVTAADGQSLALSRLVTRFPQAP